MGLSRQVAIVAGGRGVATASLFLVNAILARTWTVADFGRFSAVWILGNTLAPVFLMGVPAALLYALPRRDPGEPRRRLVAQASLLLLGSAAVLTALLGGAAEAAARLVLGTPAAAAAGALVVPFLPYVASLVGAGHVEAALVAQGRPTWAAWLAAGGAGGVVAAAVLARLHGWPVAPTLGAMSAVGVTRLLAGYLLLGVASGWPRRWSAAGLGDFVGYAAHVGLNDAVGSLSRAVDRVVVLTFLGVADLALYHVGAIEVPVSLFLAAVVTVLVPQVSRLQTAGRMDEVARLFTVTVGRLGLLILPLFAFLFAHADVLIDLYLPGAYERTTQVFRVFLLALPLRCAVYNPVLVGSGKARWALYGSLGDLAANALLSVALVLALRSTRPEWVLLGPAVATVAATWSQVAVLVALLARLLGRTWRTVLPWGRLLRAGLVSAAAAVLSLRLAAALGGPPEWRLLVGAAVFAPLTLTGLWAWRRADWEDLVVLVRAVGDSTPAPEGPP